MLKKLFLIYLSPLPGGDIQYASLMVGFLTCRCSSRPSRKYIPVVIYSNQKIRLTAAGLSEIYTRVPFFNRAERTI